MLRSQIPARLRVSRAADCQRIPAAALAKMIPADVAPRLLAADEFRRRASVPHLDGDLVRYRTSLASEVLTTADPKRAAQLVAKAGITPQEATPAPLAKAMPAGGQRSAGRSITVPTPALDELGRSRSLLDGLTSAARKGQLGALQRELGLVAAAHADLSGVSKAARYRELAQRVTDPEMRKAYRELAERARQEAGAA